MLCAASIGKSSKPNAELEVKGDNEITENEYRVLAKTYDYIGSLHVMNRAYDIMHRNAQEFLSYTTHEALNEMYFDKKRNENIGLNANRLVSNFCTSVNIFVDYADTAAKRQGEAAREKLRELCSELFDQHFEYRFFYKLRNYCIHYSYPYTGLTASADGGITLNCSKENLMKYSGWGSTLKNDFAALPDNIDLRQYIDKLLAYLTLIKLNVYTSYAENICAAYNAIQEFRVKYSLGKPIVLDIESKDKISIRSIPFEIVMNDMKVLEYCPEISMQFEKAKVPHSNSLDGQGTSERL